MVTPAASAPADDFLGSGHKERLQLLAAAESALTTGFSTFQRTEVLGVTAHVTKWGLIAGGGKSQMLLACAHMAHAISDKNLIRIAAPTNKAALDLYEKVAAIIAKDEIAHLAVVPGDGPSGYTHYGVNWLQEMVERAMPVEAGILAAVDSAIACLARLWPSTDTDIREGKPHPVRKLVVLLYALRHECSDRHVLYSAAEKVEPTVLQKVRIFVSSVSTLLKANSKMSPRAVFLGGD